MLINFFVKIFLLFFKNVSLQVNFRTLFFKSFFYNNGNYNINK